MLLLNNTRNASQGFDLLCAPRRVTYLLSSWQDLFAKDTTLCCGEYGKE
jgi:hypothetical protein